MSAETQVEKNLATSMVENFLKQFQATCNRQVAPTAREFEPFLADNFQISSNGRLAAKNLLEYLTRISEFQKKYSHVEVSAFLEEPLVSGNRIVVQYSADLVSHQTEKKVLVNIMAIATLEHGVISHWSQVAHEMGKDEWEPDFSPSKP